MGDIKCANPRAASGDATGVWQAASALAFDFCVYSWENVRFIVHRTIFLIVDFFDGLSTIAGVNVMQVSSIKMARCQNAKSALVADAVVRLLFDSGTTSITAFWVGIASSQGAKTGLAAVMVAGLFLISLFLKFQSSFSRQQWLRQRWSW